MRAPGIKRRTGSCAGNLVRPARRSRHARSASRTEASSPASMVIRTTWESSARARRIARRICAGVCRSARWRPAAAKIDKEIDLLVRRLARHGLLEYRLGRSRSGEDEVVIEPQVPDYWPRTPQLGNDDVLVLSRFAYMRRRGNEMVLESPRAGALFKICNPKIAAALAMLSTPQQIRRLRRRDGFSRGRASRIAGGLPNPFQDRRCPRQRPPAGRGRRQSRSLGFSRSSVPRAQHRRPTRQPGGRALSICRRHLSAAGGAAALAGKENRSAQVLGRDIPRPSRRPQSFCVNVIRRASSTTERPITLAELARFLDRTARVQSTWSSRLDLGDDRA